MAIPRLLRLCLPALFCLLPVVSFAAEAPKTSLILNSATSSVAERVITTVTPWPRRAS